MLDRVPATRLQRLLHIVSNSAIDLCQIHNFNAACSPVGKLRIIMGFFSLLYL